MASSKWSPPTASKPRHSHSVNLLTEEQERMLLTRWVEDQHQPSLDRLITAHRPLVLKIASRYKAYALPLPDLVQEGYIGLLEAAHRFDLERDVRFATYAQWWIKSSIQDYVLRNGGAVRTVTSSRQKSLLFTLRKILSEPEADSMPDAALKSSLAARFSVSEAAVDRMAMRLGVRDASLDAPVGGSEDLTIKDVIADDRESPEEVLLESDERSHRRAWLQAALDELPERERRIIVERHLDEDRPILRDLGDSFGVSKERVRQLEKRALDRLRKSMERQRDEAQA